jgi:AcrR family transcriptional regulator
MPTKKMTRESSGSRQSAYLARNRVAILEAAQEVLAEIGPSATIEQIALHAQISTTTLYKYFPTKELLFSEALKEIWERWVSWSYGNDIPGENFEIFIGTARKLFWVKQTHPLLAAILQNTLSEPTFIINSVRENGESVMKIFSQSGVVKNEDFDKRIILFGYCLVGLLTSVLVTEELTPAEAERSLGIALSIWGLSEAKAAKIMARKLNFTTIQ